MLLFVAGVRVACRVALEGGNACEQQGPGRSGRKAPAQSESEPRRRHDQERKREVPDHAGFRREVQVEILGGLDAQGVWLAAGIDVVLADASTRLSIENNPDATRPRT